jgi:hypothetical protein
MSSTEIEAGTLAATEISKTILELINKGIDPSAISIAATGVALAMLTEHYGMVNGGEIGHELVEKAKSGELKLYPGLKAANANTIVDD